MADRSIPFCANDPDRETAAPAITLVAAIRKSRLFMVPILAKLRAGTVLTQKTLTQVVQVLRVKTSSVDRSVLARQRDLLRAHRAPWLEKALP
jgi:hypothetical protein